METCEPIRLARAHCAVLVAILYLLIPVFSSAQRHGRASSFPLKHKTTALTVEGRIARPLYLSRDDFRSFPRSTVRVAQSSGETFLYEGVPLIEILRKAGAPIGGLNKEELRTYIEVTSRKRAEKAVNTAQNGDDGADAAQVPHSAIH